MTKECAVSFTGYRKSKILSTYQRNLFNCDSSNTEECLLREISTRLESTITMLYDRGCRTFISGMSEGFDLLAAEAVLKAKESHSDIRLVLAIPFNKQNERYTDEDNVLYYKIYALADEVNIISDEYHDRVFLDRNDYMISNSSILVAYYNGLRGGTMYTYNRALRAEMEIINIY